MRARFAAPSARCLCIAPSARCRLSVDCAFGALASSRLAGWIHHSRTSRRRSRHEIRSPRLQPGVSNAPQHCEPAFSGRQNRPGIPFCRPLKRARLIGKHRNPPAEAGGYGSPAGSAGELRRRVDATRTDPTFEKRCATRTETDHRQRAALRTSFRQRAARALTENPKRAAGAISDNRQRAEGAITRQRPEGAKT
jgi:hypothetical protein